MFEWKVEEMVLMNNHNEVYTGLSRVKMTTYTCENFVSRKDKVTFVDGFQNGKLSYILSLIKNLIKIRKVYQRKIV